MLLTGKIKGPPNTGKKASAYVLELSSDCWYHRPQLMARKKRRRVLRTILFGLSIIVTTVLVLAVALSLWGDKLGVGGLDEVADRIKMQVSDWSEQGDDYLSEKTKSEKPSQGMENKKGQSDTPSSPPMDSYSDTDKRRLEKVLEKE